MDAYLRLKSKLNNRDKVSMANLGLLQSPLLLPAFKNADCVLLDKEHGLYGTEELVPLLMQCRRMHLPSIVRVEDSAYHLIAKAIYLGADGIMIPRTETAEQVRTAVDAMHFPPIGRAGFGGWGIFRDGESSSDFQHGRVLLLQIESPKGLEAMPAIIEGYGDYIDGFIIGPNDYSIMMGIPFQHDHPAMIKEFEKFFSVCDGYRKSCGIYDPDLEHARLHRKMGANIFWIGSDTSYLSEGFSAQLRGLAELE